MATLFALVRSSPLAMEMHAPRTDEDALRNKEVGHRLQIKLVTPPESVL